MKAIRSAPHLAAAAVALALVALVAIIARARLAATVPDSSPTVSPPPTATATASPSPTAPEPSATPIPPITPTWTPTAGRVGPEYLEGHNPLTGLPVADVSTLFRVPLLVSITEFPPSARPQAGLSAAAQVWETSIGEGMSRFLAVYYGDYLQALGQMLEANPEFDLEDAALGPVRSGRVGYEEIRRFYPGGRLITRYASPEVAEQLSNLVTVYADDVNDVNSAVLTLAELQELQQNDADPNAYASLSFDARIPPGGVPGPTLDIIYNLYNQIRWVYDPARGVYLRWQDRADGTGALHPLRDRLSGKQLQADNIVLMFARHEFENVAGTILEIELAFLPKRNGFLFRDGKMYEIVWSTRHLKLQLEDDQGQEIPLKPGNTFFELISFQSTWDEAERLARFHSPPLPTLTPTPTFTKTALPTQTPEPPTGIPEPPADTPEP